MSQLQLAAERLSESSQMPAVLPKLGYEYSELAPVLSEELMSLHHGKHHQLYVNNLNAIFQQVQEASAKGDSIKVAQLQGGLKFNLGGHLNHSMYWKNLAPKGKGGGVLPGADSPLTQAINQQFGGYESFIKQFVTKTAAIQGSGWGWLVYDIQNKVLRITETANQDMPDLAGLVPLLAIDAWEHAWYVDYKNVKATYYQKIWEILNWADVEARYVKALTL